MTPLHIMFLILAKRSSSHAECCFQRLGINMCDSDILTLLSKER